METVIDSSVIASEIYKKARSEMLIATDWIELPSVSVDATTKSNYIAIRQLLRDFTPEATSLMSEIGFGFVTREYIRDIARQKITAAGLPVYKEFGI